MKSASKIQPERISSALARRLSLRSQGFGQTVTRGRGKSRVLEILNHLGYIQIDTIAVLERAHHHTLWTRFPEYRPSMLHTLQAKDRAIFEYWGHALSYLPIEDYRFCLHRMKSFCDPNDKWEKGRMETYGHLMKSVVQRIREEGPLGTRDFQQARRYNNPGTWHGRGERVALEMAFWRGDLMIRERRNFERIYDLPERVLPDHIDTSAPTLEELGRFLVRRTLAAHGLADEKTIRDHIRGADRATIQAALQAMTEEGEIVPVHVEGCDKATYHARADMIVRARRFRAKLPQVSLLSPFDNLVIHRDRIRQLFGFDYVLECYVPAPKRRYGYFVLPILYGEQFAGRMDARADRQKQTFEILTLSLEDGFRADDAFLSGLAEKLSDYARFNGCENVNVKRTTPSRLRNTLRKCLTGG